MISARVASLEPSIIREMYQRRKPTSIDLTLGEPALAPDAGMMDRAWKALNSGPQGYTLNAGLVELRSMIASHHHLSERGGPEHVVITVGSEEAVYLTMLSLTDPGDEVLVPEPGYPAYRGIARLIGATPVPYYLRRETGLVARFEAIKSVITRRTKALILNGPSNPFGTIDDPEELQKIARFCEEHKITVISDEIYSDLYYGPTAPDTITRMTERSVLVTGLSKSCAMTGLRLGYMIASEQLIKKATLAHQLVVTCGPRLAQLAAIEVFKQPSLLRAHVPFYAAARKAIEAVRGELPAEAPLLLGDGAFYAILDVSRYGDPMSLALDLLDAEDVVAVPGVAFGPTGDWFWRLSYAAGADAITEGLRRIARFLKNRRPT